MESKKDSKVNKPVTNDPRFIGIHNDPKFKQTKTKNLRIELDDRFTKKDLEFKRKAKVDKYGRRVDKIVNEDSKDFDKYFVGKNENETNKSLEVTDDNKSISVDRARGELDDNYISSSDESSSDSSDESDNSEVVSDESEVEVLEDNPSIGEPSRKLAVVNLDWDNVRSIDLLVAFNSFVPKDGKIEKIAIYQSEFGKERMKKEEVEGPPKELFTSKKKKKEKNDDSDIDIKDLYEENDGENDYDTKTLRRYQLERLRYYYAVVYCDSSSTSESIYQNCDGTEYESTANIFDLRYIPDDITFDDEPRDECSSIPKYYKPLQFSTDALQHSKVKLTWDETPADRVQLSKRAFTQKEIEDMDFQAYLASSSSESEDESNDQMKNKLKSLVNSSVQIADRSLFNFQNEKEDVDLEITFTPGLDDDEKKDDDKYDESTIDKIKRKEKERRKKRKERVRELKNQDEKKDKLNDTMSLDNDKQKAELELLMMEDEQETGSKINKKVHFNMNEIVKSEKEKSKKNKYQNKNRIIEDNFKPDLNDPRFNEIFEDHAFAIDPSQPEFKNTKAMKEILKERSIRSHSKNFKKRKADSSVSHSHNKSDLKNLVEKLKNKNKKSRN